MAFRMRTISVALLCSTLLVPTAVSVQASAPSPAPGKYRGTTLDEGEPTETEFVELRVSRNGRKVQGFRARLGMYCYVGAPVYYQIIPTVIEAPAMKIRKGKVDQGWTDVYEVDGEAHAITGALTIRFRRGRPATGRISVDFDSCRTTTADPAGPISFAVRPTR